MSEQENKRLIQKVYDSFNAGDIEALLAAFSVDIDWQVPDIEHVPFSGSRRGRQQVGEFFAQMGEQQDVQELELEDFIAQGDKVVVLGHYAWHVKSTGRKFAGDWAHVFTVRSGQIVRFQEYTDTAAAAAAHRSSA